jgi:2-deoxy-D-gluconate 3-dehydrogenase
MSGENPFDLGGLTAVVTGGSRGIGEAIALGLARAGADVVTLQRGPLSPALEALARAAGTRASAVPIDLSDAASVERAMGAVLGDTRVDILVNNAGTQIRHDSIEFPLDDFDAVLAVNLRAAFQLSQGFGRGMLERGHGKIINLASLLSFQGGLRVAAYAASKGAIMQVTKALSNEWASHGVNVNAIAPGYVATEMNAALLADATRNEQISARIPAGRWGEPSDIAGAAVFLASAASDYVHGIVLPVDGGWLGR